MARNDTPGRMWCYLWEDEADINECKFGERFVFDGQDPEKECRKRIRASVGVRKDRYDSGKIRVVKTWDVSDIAKKVGRNRQGGKVDDYLRAEIGFRKGKTGEVHTLAGDDMAVRVNQRLAKNNQPLPKAHLSRPQANELLETRALFEAGHKVLLAELCARFGKTIWSGALTKEMGTDLTIVATYVQTVTTSFMKDLTSFSQWSDYIHVDTKDADYRKKIDTALREGKKVIAYLSVCPGSLREDRIAYLKSKRVSKLLVIDEADFGAHRPAQVAALAPFGKDPRCKVLLMTGTNGDRASKLWYPSAMTSVVYPELLVAKKNTPKKVPAPYKVEGLTHFLVDEGRHHLYADVALYQADLTSAVKYAIERDPDLKGALLDSRRDYLPSWSKAAADPIKSKGFIVAMLQALFSGRHNLDDLNVDLQLRQTGPRVRMMFVPGSTKRDNMDHFVAIAKEALQGWVIIPVYGKVTSNRKAEKEVKEQVEKAEKEGKSALILSAGMAQRSFSVGEIEEVYLAYDSGDIGATAQKLSRVLTPHGKGKVGRVISLSFDPNRDDKFDAVMLETAKNLARKEETDINVALKAVFKSVDLFRFSDDGAVEIKDDDYLKGVLDLRRISRVIGATADLTKLDEETMLAVASGKVEVLRLARREIAAKGKTFKPAPKKGKGGDQDREVDLNKKTIQRVREMITTIVENSDVLMHGAGENTILASLKIIEASAEMKADVEKKFELAFDLIAFMFESGVINTNLVDLMLRKNR